MNFKNLNVYVSLKVNEHHMIHLGAPSGVESGEELHRRMERTASSQNKLSEGEGPSQNGEIVRKV